MTASTPAEAGVAEADPAASAGYLERLRALPGFLDAVTARYRSTSLTR